MVRSKVWIGTMIVAMLISMLNGAAIADIGDSQDFKNIIVDNVDSGFTDGPIKWTLSNNSKYEGQFLGINYAHDGTRNATDRWAQWTPDLPEAGEYHVYMNWVDGPVNDRPAAAPLEIKHANGTDTSITIDQRSNGGKWNYLGTYEFLAGEDHYVKIYASDTGYTVADAVKFEKAWVADLEEEIARAESLLEILIVNEYPQQTVDELHSMIVYAQSLLEVDTSKGDILTAKDELNQLLSDIGTLLISINLQYENNRIAEEEMIQIDVSGKFSDGTDLDLSEATLIFSSDNEQVATVSTNGLVQGISGGIAKITVTVTSGQVTLTEHVTVYVIGGYPHPVTNPYSPMMLTGEWFDDSTPIDYDLLPRIPNQEQAIISDVRNVDGVNQHGYLHFYDGKFWAMWSDGPGVEDRVGQRVAYSTSEDGLNWEEKKFITDYPDNSGPDSPYYNTRSVEGMRYISRGFWEKDGELLALLTLDEAGPFFGDSLQLLAYRWDNNSEQWIEKGLVYENAINNFEPKLLPNGEWMMTRRDSKFNVSFLIGGINSFDDWVSYPVLNLEGKQVNFDEPDWEVLPDGNLVALFRDRKREGYIYRGFSTDNGRSWSEPVQSNYPDATSKFVNLRLSDGRYVFISNSNPEKRDPLTLAISHDGLTYDQLFYLVGGRSVDYPHVIEHDGYLYIQHTGAKRSIEILRIPIAELSTPYYIYYLNVLEDLIADTEGMLDEIWIGNYPGEYPMHAVNDLKDAIGAALAFVLASDEETSITEINSQVDMLKQSIEHFKASQHPETISTTDPGSIIIDNTSSEFSVGPTAWSTTNNSLAFGGSFAHSGSSSASNKWAQWALDIPETGDYKVYMQWVEHANRPTAAPLEIKHSEGIDDTKTVNQKSNGAQTYCA